MKKRKIIVCIMFILLSVLTMGYGQTGSLKIIIQNFEENVIEADMVVCELFQDSVFINKKEMDVPISFFFDSLKAGIYSVKIYVKGKAILLQHGIEVKENHKLHYAIYLSNKQYIPYISGDSIADYGGGSIYFISPDSYTKYASPYFNKSLCLGFNAGPRFSSSKYFTSVIVFGSSISFVRFQKGVSAFSSPIFESERYFYWKFDSEYCFRLTGYNSRKKQKRGALADIGLQYHFPILFRHVLIDNDGDKRVATKRIHRYNDISVVGRIGYLPVSFQIEYSITTFLKKEYPELPRLKFGVALLFEN